MNRELDFPPVPPAAARSLDGFRAWMTSGRAPERGRFTFLDGELLIDMGPEEYVNHSGLKCEITAVLAALARQTRLGRVFADGALVSNAAAGVSNEPDVVFVRYDTLRSGRARLVPRAGQPGQFMELEGTPDLLVEIVSDSSVDKDTRRLRNAYHRAGVPEYWLIDARGADIHFQLLRRRARAYAAARPRDGWRRSDVFGRGFRLTRQRDRRDMWQYTLEVAPAAGPRGRSS
jgi:Uma2 family endonuclease